MTSPAQRARERVVFVKISYRVHHIDLGSRAVIGYAFEVPGWPEFHACVRFDRRESWSSKAWIADHFESGCALGAAGPINSRAAASMAVAKLLEKHGRDKVRLAVSQWKCPPASNPS